MDASSVPRAHRFGILTVGEATRHHRTALQQLITLAKYKMRRNNLATYKSSVALVVPKTDCVSAMDASSVSPAHRFGILTVGEAKGHHRTALQQLITLATYKTRRHDHPVPVALVVLKTDCGARHLPKLARRQGCRLANPPRLWQRDMN